MNTEQDSSLHRRWTLLNNLRTTNNGRSIRDSGLFTWVLFAIVYFSSVWIFAQNLPPSVRIAFPPNLVYVSSSAIFLRAAASDSDGTVAQVEFYKGTNLIGILSEPPYTNLFFPFQDGLYTFTAVATDNLGLSSTSAPVQVLVGQTPSGFQQYSILSPPREALLPALATFAIEAVMHTIGGPERATDFFIGTNLVASIAEAPFSVTVSNLVEGDYELRVHVHTSTNYAPRFVPSAFNPVKIHVVPLALSAPQKNSEGSFQFSITGRIAGRTNFIESSLDLLNWLPLQTNVPSANSFLFLDTEATNYSRRFYRVRLGP